MNHNHRIAVIGLGYVGLPLAMEFSKHYPVIGFDINKERIAELNRGEDRTLEADTKQLKELLALKKQELAVAEIEDTWGHPGTTAEILKADGIEKGLWFSDSADDLRYANTYIITVPTPIDRFKKPDLTPLLKASETVGKVLKSGDIVIYESTVYPGCTEEDCVPVLEAYSGLKFNQDFYCGYSPERINPGDKVNTLTKIKKVTSGSTAEIAAIVDKLYNQIIEAGTHKAPSMKVAEASKAIENAQRDVNISFVNELALIFEKMGIDTNDVLDAAGSKWNFLKYAPGLVGGHCIGVDPYYLAHKAESLGYHPQVILSGRRVNDFMGQFVANKVIKLMIDNQLAIKGANALVLGVSFKENCPDIRNSKVVDIYQELCQFGLQVDVYDPYADAEEVKDEYGITLTPVLNKKYSAIILAVAHNEFHALNLHELKENEKTVIFDTKAFFNRDLVSGRL
ncbi:nucleotide sugar dehydrogenase [Pedobacter sp. BS3]|uniref:nucleotide sugar dehydrogenase n=1 Tax=Pedobacter sp. BS3 TaxID=2567937 RepID=UPI0011EE0D9B|nr:nucleotide sugar dehydrogenase [Pedobacter sp. BS3]TZF84455.1 nucleotide sugar dehydrogenase [Pedobacter sp. BS3]